MSQKTFLFIWLVCAAVSSAAQSNFSYKPGKPLPGDLVTFSYTPRAEDKSGDITLDAAVYQVGKSQKASDISLVKSDNGGFTGSFRVDSSANFLYLVFSRGEEIDNNFNKGYTINLYERDGSAVKQGSYVSQAVFYMGERTAGIGKDNARVIESYEKEFARYPQSRKQNLVTGYLRARIAQDGPQGREETQKKIEELLRGGLKTETDYDMLESWYALLKKQELAEETRKQKKEKFPRGNWTIYSTVDAFYGESDLVEQRKLLDTIILKTNTDTNWLFLKERVPSYKEAVVRGYAAKKDWQGFHQAITALKLDNKMVLSSLYNDIAWEIQGSDGNLEEAEKMSALAIAMIKAEYETGSSKPERYPGKFWKKNCRRLCGMYADTYAMVLFKSGRYREGLPYAREAALEIGEGKNEDENNTYALLAEKALPLKEYRKQLEQFVKESRATPEITGILRRAYITENGSETGFPRYLDGLEQDGRQHMKAELRKSMRKETAPLFKLMDLDGKPVAMAGLKGKVVIVDFWATWCGPCIASFPGMQKVVTRYKNDPNVVFLFIDTWESGKDQKKNAAAFIAKNHYDFKVLLDTERKAVEQFKVDGIPAKFIIDRQGMIRFRETGFGNEARLVRELTAMIELAGE